jgi:hypothetical protein
MAAPQSDDHEMSAEEMDERIAFLDEMLGRLGFGRRPSDEELFTMFPRIPVSTKALILGEAFDQLHPDGRAWRTAGRPDYGFREWQERTATERGLVMGKDYEADMWTDYATIRAWCYGVLELGGQGGGAIDPKPPEEEPR